MYSNGRRGSDSVDEYVQGALKGVAVFRKRPCHFTQLRPRYRSHFLNTYDPDLPCDLNRRGEAWESRVAARVTQRSHNPRRINSNQVGLKVHNQLTAVETVEVELRHSPPTLKTSVAGQRQSFFRDLIGVGVDRRFILSAPQTISLRLRGISDCCFGETRHIEPESTGSRSNIGIQSQIDFNASHNSPTSHTYETGV